MRGEGVHISLPHGVCTRTNSKKLCLVPNFQIIRDYCEGMRMAKGRIALLLLAIRPYADFCGIKNGGEGGPIKKLQYAKLIG
ncbi:hypothetical protein LJC59_08170 [Desulfovibrio sp. OttesenSCG-928-A18]|nr:hypothetical protein [Desulfovibrio sp. OttesenSCG-928-A18]